MDIGLFIKKNFEENKRNFIVYGAIIVTVIVGSTIILSEDRKGYHQIVYRG